MGATTHSAHGGPLAGDAASRLLIVCNCFQRDTTGCRRERASALVVTVRHRWTGRRCRNCSDCPGGPLDRSPIERSLGPCRGRRATGHHDDENWPIAKWWLHGRTRTGRLREARQLAQRAETVGVILTAPDLIRFNLTSAETNGSSAQLLWSRTRGLVLSGSRLPAAPPESTYQLWLVTSTQSVGAGVVRTR